MIIEEVLDFLECFHNLSYYQVEVRDGKVISLIVRTFDSASVTHSSYKRSTEE